jgi:hypothetical protein
VYARTLCTVEIDGGRPVELWCHLDEPHVCRLAPSMLHDGRIGRYDAGAC